VIESEEKYDSTPGKEGPTLALLGQAIQVIIPEENIVATTEEGHNIEVGRS